VILIEALAALVFLAFLIGLVVFTVIRWQQRLGQRRYEQSIEGRIEKNQEALDTQFSYIEKLHQDIQNPHIPENRRQILVMYQELAQKKHAQLFLEREALEAQREAEEFERTMERREL